MAGLGGGFGSQVVFVCLHFLHGFLVPSFGLTQEQGNLFLTLA